MHEPVHADPETESDAAHTVAHEDTQDTDRLRIADVVVRYAPPDDPRLGPPAAWTAEVLARHPHCALAVYVTGPGRCAARTRDGDLVHLAGAPAPSGRPDPTNPAAYASALHAWLSGGKSLDEATAAGIVVVTGHARRHVAVERAE